MKFNKKLQIIFITLVVLMLINPLCRSTLWVLKINSARVPTDRSAESIRWLAFESARFVAPTKTQVGRACRRQQVTRGSRAMERRARECGAWHAMRTEGDILIYATGQTAASNQLDPAALPRPSGLLSAL